MHFFLCLMPNYYFFDLIQNLDGTTMEKKIIGHKND